MGEDQAYLGGQEGQFMVQGLGLFRRKGFGVGGFRLIGHVLTVGLPGLGLWLRGNNRPKTKRKLGLHGFMD